MYLNAALFRCKTTSKHYIHITVPGPLPISTWPAAPQLNAFSQAPHAYRALPPSRAPGVYSDPTPRAGHPFPATPEVCIDRDDRHPSPGPASGPDVHPFAKRLGAFCGEVGTGCRPGGLRRPRERRLRCRLLQPWRAGWWSRRGGWWRIG